MAEQEIVGMDSEVQQKRVFKGFMAAFLTAFAVGFSLFMIVGLQLVVIDLWIFKAIVLMLVMIYGFLTIPGSPKRRGRFTLLDLLLMIAGVAPCIYVVVDIERLQWTYGSSVPPLDIVFGALLILALLELTRRTFGWAMPLIALGFLAYGLFGNYLPASLFGHIGLKPGNVIGFMIGEMAIFGPVMTVMVQVIFLFMLFSAFVQISGTGDFFVNLANGLCGRWRGGPAKVSVFSSSLFGTISGSSIANVAVDGAITIPLMMKTGFRPAFAAAVEATASTGGQIMPPIMGAGAFIMAELLSISYREVIIAAAVPAILFYVGLYCMIDLEAVKQGLRGLSKSDTPKVWYALKMGGHLLIPIFVLIYETVIAGASMPRAALLSIATVLPISWLRRESRIDFTRLIQALKMGAVTSISLAGVCACAGIIIGVVSMTGLGVKFGSGIMALTHGNLFMTLLFTAVICLFLGMGLPTTAAYIIAAAVGVPALLKLGVNPLAAHLFVFYFACMSAITPPVCGAVYTACGFSGTSVMETGWIATRLGISAYFVPFILVYHPVLMLKGSGGEIIQGTITALIGVIAVSMSIIGTSYTGNIRWGIFRRILFLAAFFGLIIPGTFTDLLGVLILGIAILSHAKVREGISNYLWGAQVIQRGD